VDPKAANRKILWFSIAGLALLGAVTLYALTQSTTPDPRVEDSIAARAADLARSDPPDRDDGGGPSVTIPAGTTVTLILQTPLRTASAAVGERFTARVSLPVRVAGTTVIPAGAEVQGHVALSEPAGAAGGRLQLAYDTVHFAGRTYRLDSMSRIHEGRSGLEAGTSLEMSLDRAVTVRPAGSAQDPSRPVTPGRVGS
jgi:hypothetical protein